MFTGKKKKEKRERVVELGFSCVVGGRAGRRGGVKAGLEMNGIKYKFEKGRGRGGEDKCRSRGTDNRAEIHTPRRAS